MGWLFTRGTTRKDHIADRTRNWEAEGQNGETVKTTCLAHCYRGNFYSGVLWTVWERTFTKDGQQTKPVERWIGCDLLRYQTGFGWGYKDMEESMFPYRLSCPLKYLALVPIEQFGGCERWRECVKEYHRRQKERRLIVCGDTA